MKIWNTKYALTSGIIEQEGEYVGNGMVQLGSYFPTHYLYGEGIEWSRTREEAVVKAEMMREEEIARLRKRIEALEVLRFDQPK